MSGLEPTSPGDRRTTVCYVHSCLKTSVGNQLSYISKGSFCCYPSFFSPFHLHKHKRNVLVFFFNFYSKSRNWKLLLGTFDMTGLENNQKNCPFGIRAGDKLTLQPSGHPGQSELSRRPVSVAFSGRGEQCHWS